MNPTFSDNFEGDFTNRMIRDTERTRNRDIRDYPVLCRLLDAYRDNAVVRGHIMNFLVGGHASVEDTLVAIAVSQTESSTLYFNRVVELTGMQPQQPLLLKGEYVVCPKCNSIEKVR